MCPICAVAHWILPFSTPPLLLDWSAGAGCATVAEVRKRGKDFWAEFEFYLSDLLVGLVMDVVLVSLMAPVAVIGSQSRRQGATGKVTPAQVMARWHAVTALMAHDAGRMQ